MACLRLHEMYDHPRGGRQIMHGKTIAGSILLTLSIVVAVAMLPDIVRYMKIRAM